jgi:hypothetical protein
MVERKNSTILFNLRKLLMGLKLHYPLLGELTDYSESQNNLVRINDSGKLVVSSEGILGKSLKRSSLNDGADFLRSTTKLNLVGDQTFMCWAKVTSAHSGTANGLVTHHDHEKNTGMGITIADITPTDFRLSCNTGNGTSRTFHTFKGSTNIYGNWHHLVVRYNDATKKLSLWVDGLKDYETTYTIVSGIESIELFNWSLKYSGSAEYRPACEMNDVRIYDHACSDKEIYDVSKAKILHYDFNEEISYQNNLLSEFNPDFANVTSTAYTDARNMSLHPNMISLASWSAGYNDGVSSPQVGYHAFATREGKNESPCIKFINKNGQFGHRNRWMGVASPHTGTLTSLGLGIGDQITISTEFKSDTIGFEPKIGIYHNSLANGSSTFGSAIKYFQSNVNSGNLNQWIKVVATFTIDSDWNLNGFNQIYIYGHEQEEGILWVDNVSLKIGKHTKELPFNGNGNLTAQVVKDKSGYKHNSQALSLSSPTWMPSTTKGVGAMYFGESAVNRHLLVPFPSLTQSFTASIWMRSTDIGNVSRGIIGKSTSALGTSGWAGWVGWGDDFRLNVNGYTDSPLNSAGIDSTLSLCTISFDSRTGKKKVYINGSLVQTVTVAATALNTNTELLKIGATTGVTDSFKGWFEDVQIFATALSDDDVRKLFTSKGSLDNIGQLSVDHVIANGFKPTLVDYSAWKLGETAAAGWSRNGAIAENTIRRGVNPHGVVDILWASDTNDTVSDADGGYNTSQFLIDHTKTYRISQWIKRRVQGNGSVYLGTHGYDSGNNDTALLNHVAGTPNTNPYITANGSTYTNEWFYVVGYVYSSDTPAGQVNADAGVYNNAGFKIGSDSWPYRWSPTARASNLRSYLYYSTDPSTSQEFYRPRMEVMDGSQPSIATLTACKEHLPLLSPSGNGYRKMSNYYDKNVGINSRGVLECNNISTEGITAGLAGYWKFDGTDKDYSYLNSVMTSSAGAVVSSNGLTGGFLSTSTPMQKGLLNRDLTVVMEVTVNSFVNGSRYGLIQIGFYDNELAVNVGGNGQIEYYFDSNHASGYTSIYSPITIGKRAILMFVRSPSGIKCYLDGTLVATSNEQVNPTTEGSVLTIGSSYTGSMESKSTIHSCKLFSRALSADEIAIEVKHLSNKGMSIHKDGTVYLQRLV